MPIRKSDKIIRRIKPKIIKNNNKLTNKSINNTRNYNNPNTNLKYSFIDKIWKDETVYIVGGGPSLKDFQWSKLKDKKIIAINRAYEVLPWAEVLYWTDTRFYKWYKSDIDKFRGIKVTCRACPTMTNDIIVLKPTNKNKIDLRSSYIAHGNNSGYGAINLAVKLGAKKIYLLGYDMNSKPNQSHWHSGYSVNHVHSVYPKMIEQFYNIKNDVKHLNIHIFNANVKSKLECFRKCTIEDAIYDRAHIPTQNV